MSRALEGIFIPKEEEWQRFQRKGSGFNGKQRSAAAYIEVERVGSNQVSQAKSRRAHSQDMSEMM